jgi:hypothetical protein
MITSGARVKDNELVGELLLLENELDELEESTSVDPGIDVTEPSGRVEIVGGIRISVVPGIDVTEPSGRVEMEGGITSSVVPGMILVEPSGKVVVWGGTVVSDWALLEDWLLLDFVKEKGSVVPGRVVSDPSGSVLVDGGMIMSVDAGIMVVEPSGKVLVWAGKVVSDSEPLRDELLNELDGIGSMVPEMVVSDPSGRVLVEAGMMRSVDAGRIEIEPSGRVVVWAGKVVKDCAPVRDWPPLEELVVIGSVVPAIEVTEPSGRVEIEGGIIISVVPDIVVTEPFGKVEVWGRMVVRLWEEELENPVPLGPSEVVCVTMPLKEVELGKKVGMELDCVNELDAAAELELDGNALELDGDTEFEDETEFWGEEDGMFVDDVSFHVVSLLYLSELV